MLGILSGTPLSIFGVTTANIIITYIHVYKILKCKCQKTSSVHYSTCYRVKLHISAHLILLSTGGSRWKGGGDMASAVAWAYNRGQMQGQSQEQSPMKLKAFWQSCAEFPPEYFVFFKYFYHVHMLFQRGMWPCWTQHMTGSGVGGITRLPPPWGPPVLLWKVY